MARDTLLDYFADFAAAPGPYLVDDDGLRIRRRSYAETAAAARGLAARLAHAGVGRGHHVVLWSENRAEWVAAFWACLLRGAVVVPVDARSSAAFLQRVAARVAPRLVLVGDEVEPVPAEIAVPVWRLADLDWGDAPPSPEPVPITSDDVVEVVFTSGATDEPKGVVITHRNILANIRPVEAEIAGYRRWVRLVRPLTLLTLLPLSHMFGQALAMFVPPLLPAVVLFTRSHHPVELVRTVRRHRVSVLVGVPQMLETLAAHVRRVVAGVEDPPRPGHWIRRWWQYRRLHRHLGLKFWAFVVGGAPLDPDVEAFWASRSVAVIQGYGLTETAPIVTMSHPFRLRRGSVGRAIAGVDVKVAEDGELLVRGENVSRGYHGVTADTADDGDGWLHTGDLGEIGADGQVYVRGRKKEVIVAADGTNVFPTDVERVVEALPGVRESAAVGVAAPTVPGERVHAVVVADTEIDPAGLAREANARLEPHQRIWRVLVWPGRELPRTDGTRKLKRTAIRDWVRRGADEDAGAAAGTIASSGDTQDDRLAALVARHTGRPVDASTTFDELGLGSLDRVELLAAVEDAFQTRLDEQAFAGAGDVAQLRTLVERSAGDAAGGEHETDTRDLPVWTRAGWARAVRRAALTAVLLPLTRVFVRLEVGGQEHLARLTGPVVFAANHQSYLDTPAIFCALPRPWRFRVAPAMSKEFFTAYFYPTDQPPRRRVASGVVYRLAVLLFQAFPLPQRHPGARHTMRYIGATIDAGVSILLFPEGELTDSGAMTWFRPGIGMMASRLGVPVVPVRIDGMDRVLHRRWRMARPARVRITFGAALRLAGDDYEALAREVEAAVRALPPGPEQAATARYVEEGR